MNKLFLLIAIIIQTGYSFSQINKNQIIKNVNSKYIGIHIYVPGKPIFGDLINIHHGTGFIIHYKEEYFLVSCYHILTGRIWEDTTFFDKILDKEPPVVRVRFHTISDNDSANKLYPLKDLQGYRNILSVPVDKVTRRAIDISFLKIGDIPNNAIINTIELNNIRKTWKLKPNQKLLVYGFSKREMNDKFAYCDTVLTVGNKSFTHKDNFILVYNVISMQGSSGSPVFDAANNFMGIFFAVIPSEWQQNTDYNFVFKNNAYTKSIGLIITSNYLKESLDAILK